MSLRQVVPTVRGHMFVVSNKMTAAKPGEYEPSLDSAESQWAASQLALGPRAEKPYCTDEGDEASGFGVPEPTMVGVLRDVLSWHVSHAAHI